VRFDAVDDFVQPAVNYNPSIFTEINVCAWRSLGTHGLRNRADGGNNGKIYQYPAGTLDYGSYPYPIQKSGAIQVDVPLVIAVSQEESSVVAGAAILYVNGAAVSSGVEDTWAGSSIRLGTSDSDLDHALRVIFPAVLTPHDVYRASRFLMARFGIAA
jgi:hypothetical protein